jgi:hypothetical protein
VCVSRGGNYSMENILKGARGEEKAAEGGHEVNCETPEGGFR